MREGEPAHVVSTFRALGVPVELVDAKARFFAALAGLTDPEEKRNAITQTFYKDGLRAAREGEPARRSSSTARS